MPARSFVAATLAAATMTTVLATPAGADPTVSYTAKTGSTPGVCIVTYTGDDKAKIDSLTAPIILKNATDFITLNSLLDEAGIKSQEDKKLVLLHYFGYRSTGEKQKGEAVYAKYTENIKNKENQIKEIVSKIAWLAPLFTLSSDEDTATIRLTKAQANAIANKVPGFLTGYTETTFTNSPWGKNPGTQDMSLISLSEAGIIGETTNVTREEVNKLLPTGCNKYFAQESGSSSAPTADGKLSPGAIAGIVVAVIAVVGALGAWATGMIPGLPALLMPR